MKKLLILLILITGFCRAQNSCEGKLIKIDSLPQLKELYEDIENSDRFRYEFNRFETITNGMLLYKLQDGLEFGTFTILSLNTNDVTGFVNGNTKEVKNKKAIIKGLTDFKNGYYVYHNPDDETHKAIWLIMIKVNGGIKSCYYSWGYPCFPVRHEPELQWLSDCFVAIEQFSYR